MASKQNGLLLASISRWVLYNMGMWSDDDDTKCMTPALRYMYCHSWLQTAQSSLSLIFTKPSLLLDHVNILPSNPKSIAPESNTKFLKLDVDFSQTFSPPFFSPLLLILLKSPIAIQDPEKEFIMLLTIFPKVLFPHLRMRSIYIQQHPHMVRWILVNQGSHYIFICKHHLQFHPLFPQHS